MTRRQFRLKRKTGFFAAGEEFGPALQGLGDAAFRLFGWVCLRAVLLGSARKSVAMINRQSAGPLASLRSFEYTLCKVQDCDCPETYWRHLDDHFQKCEAYRERRRRPPRSQRGREGQGKAAAMIPECSPRSPSGSTPRPALLGHSWYSQARSPWPPLRARRPRKEMMLTFSLNRSDVLAAGLFATFTPAGGKATSPSPPIAGP